eukprot:CAMPEP_0202862074 /NCGR_PEP_ID=MMETSP1391-20130828/3249_1 /ASSEMBLY_ACC=CAM_ASM_000867 /TAXON_ID=1034604 /ORGANISM="Chlamydomonas leiostraca, Strain SAG 11-49" /LENGTH=127 /DNA_ID=CAMNT_0049541557 /DNA_START=152 /DNA_END=531 /DNA_ORIENTATION=-
MRVHMRGPIEELWLYAVLMGGKENYYELLEVSIDADEDTLKTSFRRLAKQLHPDVNEEDDAHEAFMALKRAYDVLSDPQRRARYDRDNGLRRLNFFRDVEEPSGPPAWGWGRSSARPGDSEEEEGGS